MTATNIAFLRARPDREPAVAEALQRLVELSRDNPDCFLSHLHRSEEDPALWFLYENWSGHAALWQHLGTSPVQDLVRRTQPLLHSDFGLRSFRLQAPSPSEPADCMAA